MCPRVYAITRQFTGAPRQHRAYVYAGNRVLVACPHRHRFYRTAQACAERMLKKRLRELRLEFEGPMGKLS